MQKYYSSSEYEITDGHLDRTGAWSLRFDNNSPNHVSVFLGDLGRDLPSKEQVYWKSFNLIPDEEKLVEQILNGAFWVISTAQKIQSTDLNKNLEISKNIGIKNTAGNLSYLFPPRMNIFMNHYDQC